MLGNYGGASKRPRLDDQLGNEWDDDLPVEVFEEVCMRVEQSQVPPDDFSRLHDQLKTKEGEISILRAKLRKESEETAAALRSAKIAETKHKEALTALERHLTAELEFKDIEITTLTKRCKELEVNGPNGKVSVVAKSPQVSKITDQNPTGNFIEKLKIEDFRENEGKQLAEMVTSDFFVSQKEPNPLLLYKKVSPPRARWEQVPAFQSHILETYPLILELFKCKTFPEDILGTLCNIFQQILNNLHDILRFFTKEAISAGKPLTDEKMLTLNLLLSPKLLADNELGIETRRSLALMSLVIKISQTYQPPKKLLGTMLNLVVCIRTIQKSGEYSGVLAGICYFLHAVLLTRGKKPNTALKKLGNAVSKELILVKPPLNVVVCFIDGFMELVQCTEKSSDSNFGCPIRLLIDRLNAGVEFGWVFQISGSFFNWAADSRRKFEINNCCNLIPLFVKLLDKNLELIDTDCLARMNLEKGLVILYDFCPKDEPEKLLTLEHLKLFPKNLIPQLNHLIGKPKDAADWLINIYDYQLSNLETFKNTPQSETGPSEHELDQIEDNTYLFV